MEIVWTNELLVVCGVLILVLLMWLLNDRSQTKYIEHKSSKISALEESCNVLLEEKRGLQLEHASLQERLHQFEQQITRLEQTVELKEHQNNQLKEQLAVRQSDIAALDARMSEERKAASEKLALLEEAKAKLSAEFKLLASQIFEEKGRMLAENNQQNLNQILKPVQSELQSFRQRIETVHKEDVEARGSLKQQLENLQTLNHQMNEEAKNLTRALKGDKKMQGDWGELILETVLEQSGLRKDKEYTTQGSFRDDGGNFQRPDVIINLPDGKHIIVDSKVSLVAYNAYMNAEDEQQAERALKEHVQAVSRHIESLSEKDYASLEGLKSPDFVFMFMPIEAAFMAAFQHDEALFSRAFERHIVVVTPTTLLATLRTVESIWRYERQNENARRIAKQAASVYDKLRGFLEDFEKVGTQLDTVNKTYDRALNKLSQGRGNLIRQAENFVELGVKVKKQLPKKFSDDAALTDESEPHKSVGDVNDKLT